MGGAPPATTSQGHRDKALATRCRRRLLRLVLAGALALAAMASYACSTSSSGGNGSMLVEAGTNTGDGAVAAEDGAGSSSGLVGSTSSGGVPSGSGGSGSGGGSVVFTCGGCIDLQGQCNDGGADDKCGSTGGGCVNCTAFHQVCGAAGECVDGSADAGASSAMALDSGSE